MTDVAQGKDALVAPDSSGSATPQIDTRERLRGELAAAQAALREKEAVVEEQGKIIGQQRLFRNHENRNAWKRVLLDEAQRYVVMEFPWITREAIDTEMLQCFEDALRRRVKLWIAWGLDEQGKAGGRVADPAVLKDITDLQKRHGVRSIRMQRRGNTHRKVLLWDGRAAIIGSFNWGSFRGDPRWRVREEIGAQVMTPREVSDLEAEYRRIFSTSSLA
jgi:phosphatidylserine/phosphatidylglycerophosphate/cardiolipin synthase-like enzyme